MKKKSSLAIALLIGALSIHTPARADGDHDHGEDHDHGRPHLPARPEPPKFHAHPRGVHPHGPMVRPHAIRVMKPRIIAYGGHSWTHWTHPAFSRPVYYWDWNLVHQVSCISEDSYGDQYPVTESAFAGFGLRNMTAIEDDTLDRCYEESGGDSSCYLATCSHF